MVDEIKNLRDLAKAYSEAAANPRNQQNAELYRAVNGLRMKRPVVLIDEQPWHELGDKGELDLVCQKPEFRAAEQFMRRRLYQWYHHPVDMILPAFLPVTKIIGGQSGGMTVREKTLTTDEANHIVSHRYIDQLADPAGLAGIKLPRLTYEKAATEALRDKLAEAIGDILPVKITGHSSYFSQWDLISVYRGVTPLLLDLAQRPEHSHAIMARVTDVLVERYRQYEELDLLDPEPLLIHCTAGLCDELETEKGQPVLRQNVWGRAMAQIFAAVSPAMHEEFDIDYQVQAMEPFGLVYYGCCEALDKKMDILRKIPRLRKISITPWADFARAAEQIGPDYVFSAKPNPAHVADAFSKETIRQELGHIIKVCRQAGCSFELVLKDISSVAVFNLYYQDISPDRQDDFTVGLPTLFPPSPKGPDSWGKIAMWAWAASRVLDFALEQQAAGLPLDPARSAVVGHSRLGKTALWAGAQDERFQYVISNDSGCSGAALTRGKTGEDIKAITDRFPYWFCPAYRTYAGREYDLPFDQHFLLAACAPRRLYIASSAEDSWADPQAEFLAAVAASEVYKKLGLTGLVTPDAWPADDCIRADGEIAYQRRPGSHYFSRTDWQRFMAYVGKGLASD